MTNLLHSSCIVCVSEKTNRNCSSCADPRTRGRNGERSKIRSGFRDTIELLRYGRTSDRRLGARRPRLSLRDATGSSRCSFDSTASITPAAFQPWRGKKVSNRDVCWHFDRVESSRFVSASTPVLHPFCKLTVIRLPRCPAVPIDRYSPIRHRDVRESRFAAWRADARTLTTGLRLASIHGHALCAIAASTGGDKSRLPICYIVS